MVRIPFLDPEAPVVVIDIGNSSTHLATWHAGQIKTPIAVPTQEHAAFAEAFDAHVAAMDGRPAAVVIASVVPEALERMRTVLEALLDQDPLVVGEQVPLPIDLEVDDPKAIGVDRVCAAAAAFETLQSGCVVIDFGTAVTVDLVDDEGTLQGGAILPGIGLQFRALHEFTAQLPLVAPGLPERPFGRNTTEAIQVGVCRGIAGAARGIVEAYATSLNRWPQVIATGGDAPFMAPHCDFVDTLVRELTLRGVGLAYTNHLAAHGA